ncbi:MAG TPA: lipid-binding SYLF domain-containing protein [Bryobacteraceae bacterium]|nr:lipid-binding SYLF domain-containing protein [Bryobacteraceae bacterium]
MRTTLVTTLALACSVSIGAFAADREAKAIDRIDAAADTVSDLMHAGDKGVPKELLENARCVVVIPGMKKAGFIFGGKYGRGFAVCRRAGGKNWSAPAAMRIEGGSVGFQIGGSEQDVLLLVMNDGGMKHILADKFTLGGDATVSAGPVGRDAQAQTDVAMHAEMLSYSRSRGLFAGISLTGATLRPDQETNRELYGHDVTNREILMGNVKAPEGARKLDMVLNSDSHMRN